MLRALLIVVFAGCVAPAPGAWPPPYSSQPYGQAPAATPAAAATPAPAPAPARHHIMTKAEIEAIPTAFPVTLVAPSSAAYTPIYEALQELDSFDIGQVPSWVLVLEDENVNVPISVEECGRPRGYYNPRTRTIHVCYELIEYANELRGKKGKQRAIVDKQIRSFMMFTAFHEIAHALIDRLRIPIDGNEEDRADELAFLFFTNMKDVELARSLVDAPAQFFRRDDEEYGPPTDGKHSAGRERAFDGLCMFYGQFLDAHAKRLLGDRADACVEYTATVKQRWNAWLRPYSRIVSGRTFSL